MQPTTPAQTPSPDVAPAAPPAPAAPRVTAALVPDGPIPLQSLPQSVEEIMGLRQRRDILRDQLSRATNRRDEIASRLNRGLDADGRAGVQQRLDLIDQRILQIERDQALTERLLANAPPALLQQAWEPPRNGAQVDEDDAFAGAFGAFTFGIVLTLVVSRIRRRFARRRATKMGLATQTMAFPTAEDPRFEQLTQTVGAMAEELERIGEGQRFVTQLLAERRNAQQALTAEIERR